MRRPCTEGASRVVSYITGMLIPERPFTPLERKLYLTNRCGYLYEHLLGAVSLRRHTGTVWVTLQWLLEYETSVMRQGYIPCTNTQDQPESKTMCSRSYLSYKAGYLVDSLWHLVDCTSDFPKEWECFQQHLCSAATLSLCEWGQEELALGAGS